jgi:hypothetical protein
MDQGIRYIASYQSAERYAAVLKANHNLEKSKLLSWMLRKGLIHIIIVISVADCQ